LHLGPKVPIIPAKLGKTIGTTVALNLDRHQ
jgi:hypothetical protein